MNSRGIRTALGANGHLGVENVFTGAELAAVEVAPVVLKGTYHIVRG